MSSFEKVFEWVPTVSQVEQAIFMLYFLSNTRITICLIFDLPLEVKRKRESWDGWWVYCKFKDKLLESI